MVIAAIYINMRPKIGGGAYLAVVNDTTDKIVWVAGGSLCVPALPNTHLVSDCSEINATAYECNGSIYHVGGTQYNCAGPVNSTT